jgi:hypothetical protein
VQPPVAVLVVVNPEKCLYLKSQQIASSRRRALRPGPPLVVPGFRDLQPFSHLHNSGSRARGSRRIGAFRVDERVLLAYRCSLAKNAEDVAVWAGDDLQVHAVLLVLAGVEGLVAGDAVDRDERPVQDDVCVTCPFSVADCLAELRGAGGEQFHGLVDVAPRRGPADPEPGREVLECLAFAQVGEHKERLLPGVQLPPPGSDRLQVPADDPGSIVQGPDRQRQRGTVKQHGEDPWG